MKINLKTATDAELNAAFFAYVTNELLNLTDYVHSADAVLPWLERTGFFRIGFHGSHGWVIEVKNPNQEGTLYLSASANSLAKCDVIALLRGNGVEVIE